MGLAPMVVTRLLQAVRDAADRSGTAVLLVEQHVRQALRYADRAYVMRRGRIALSGSATELGGRLAEIEDSYLASAPHAPHRPTTDADHLGNHDHGPGPTDRADHRHRRRAARRARGRRPAGAAAGARPRHRRPLAAARRPAHRPAADGRGPGRPDARAAGRRSAPSPLETLVAFRDGGSVAAPMPTGPDLRQILEFMAGGLDIDEYLPMMREELALTADLRAPRWHKDDVNPDKPFKVVIIGAGMSGIVAAYRLAEADVPYIVVDKNADVGGTWLENSYPGCRVDIPNHYYSYSFAQRDDWPLYYSPRSELHKYFRECVDEFGIRPNIRFNTEVSSVAYDDATATWTVETVDADGHEGTIQANAVISAVGQLNRPQLPKIEGRESFAGPAFHSARWDHGVDLTGKRVGVIGTGCSAAQFAPIVAEQVEHLEIFQRTPNWQFPVPHYKHEVPQGFQYLLGARAVLPPVVPLLAVLEVGRAAAPDGRGRPRLARHVEVGRRGQRPAARAADRGASCAQYPDRPDLLEKALPQYPPAAKRIIVDDGVVGGDAAPRQRHADDDGHRADRAGGRRDGRRRAARVRRAALRHRVPAVEVPDAR